MADGYNGRFNRRGDKIHARRKQDWAIGATVRVGFMAGLTVESKQGADYILCSQKGKRYSFTPHLGISELVGPSFT